MLHCNQITDRCYTTSWCWTYCPRLLTPKELIHGVPQSQTEACTNSTVSSFPGFSIQDDFWLMFSYGCFLTPSRILRISRTFSLKIISRKRSENLCLIILSIFDVQFQFWASSRRWYRVLEKMTSPHPRSPSHCPRGWQLVIDTIHFTVVLWCNGVHGLKTKC